MMDEKRGKILGKVVSEEELDGIENEVNRWTIYTTESLVRGIFVTTLF